MSATEIPLSCMRATMRSSVADAFLALIASACSCRRRIFVSIASRVGMGSSQENDFDALCHDGNGSASSARPLRHRSVFRVTVLLWELQRGGSLTRLFA